MRAIGYVIRFGGERGGLYYAGSDPESIFLVGRQDAYVFESLPDADRMAEGFRRGGWNVRLAVRAVPVLTEADRYFAQRLAEHPDFWSASAERSRAHAASGNYSPDRP